MPDENGSPRHGRVDQRLAELDDEIDLLERELGHTMGRKDDLGLAEVAGRFVRLRTLRAERNACLGDRPRSGAT